MYHREGGTGVQLIEEPDNARTMGAAFGANERYIWYGRRTGTWQYNSPGSDYQLWTYDRESGTNSNQSGRYGGAFRPTLSPDGKWLVYGSRHISETGLRIRNLTNGDERWLAFPVQRDDQESRAARDAYPGMSFTPDSREVVTFYDGKLWRVPVDGSEPIEVPFRVDAEVPMGPEVDFDYPIEDSPTFIAKQIRDIAPSPSGEQLAFTVMGDLYVMSAPGGDPRRLSQPDAVTSMPTWSPDGERIVFVTYSQQEGGHLYSVKSNGTDLERLTDQAAFYTEPVWSLDGERIVAIRAPRRAYEEALTQNVQRGSADLIWLPSEGGSSNLISQVSGLRKPHFSQNIERIYAFQSGTGLISMRWDGSDQREHVQVRGGNNGGSGPGSAASLIVMSPQGLKALAQVENQLYVVAVPPGVGVDAPTISVADPEGASFPVSQLTDIGGQFPVWGSSGREAHWALGNAHFVYDLDAAEQFADSLDAANGSGVDDEDEEDSEVNRYRPEEWRIKVEFERDIPTGLVALTGARIITMNGNEILEHGDILVRDNRIEFIGPSGSIPIPDSAERLDVSGKTIVPGFVDTHAHLRGAFNVHRSPDVVLCSQSSLRCHNCSGPSDWFQ